MKIYEKILGNINSAHWSALASECQVDTIWLDRWSAQKSRVAAVGESGQSYPISLERNHHLSDGDIIEYLPEQGRLVVVRLQLGDVMVIDLKALLSLPTYQMLRLSLELGHALGNQHWAAVVKDDKVYVPLVLDRKVMDSVMRTHHLEHIDYHFTAGDELLPMLAPHEVRRLFGSRAEEERSHTKGEAPHIDCHSSAKSGTRSEGASHKKEHAYEP